LLYKITSIFKKEKWVSTTHNHRFAYPTVERAIHHFRIRATRRVHFLSTQLEVAKMSKQLIETFKSQS